MANVRPATVDDVPELIGMGRRMHDESPHYAHLGYDPPKIEVLLANLMNGAGAVFVAEELGETIGMFLGLVATRYFSHDTFACDLLAYVKPEHRGGFAFVRLVRAFERWAEKKGARDVCLGVSTGVAFNNAVMLYERMGYVRVGISTSKRIN